MFRSQGVFYPNFGYIRIRACSLRGSFVLHFWVTTPANLDFSITTYLCGLSAASRRILVKTLRMTHRWVPHVNSVILSNLVGRILSRPPACNSLIHLTCSNFHFVIYFARFTFTGFAPGVSGKTEEETAIRIHTSLLLHM